MVLPHYYIFIFKQEDFFVAAHKDTIVEPTDIFFYYNFNIY